MNSKIKDAIMICLIGFIFFGSIIYNAYYNDIHRLEIVKERIKDTTRIVIALHEFKKYDVKKDFVYSFVGKKYEVITEITDEDEVRAIRDAILNAEETKDIPTDISLNMESATLIQFYNNKNKKLAEYDLESIKPGFGIREIYITLDKDTYDKIRKYYDDYSDKISEYFQQKNYIN